MNRRRLLAALGPFLVGLWFDRTGSYDTPFIGFAVLFSLAALALALASYPRAPERTVEQEAARQASR